MEKALRTDRFPIFSVALWRFPTFLVEKPGLMKPPVLERGCIRGWPVGTWVSCNALVKRPQGREGEGNEGYML